MNSTSVEVILFACNAAEWQQNGYKPSVLEQRPQVMTAALWPARSIICPLKNSSEGFNSMVQRRNTQWYLQTSQGMEIVPAVPLLPLPRKVFCCLGYWDSLLCRRCFARKTRAKAFFLRTVYAGDDQSMPIITRIEIPHVLLLAELRCHYTSSPVLKSALWLNYSDTKTNNFCLRVAVDAILDTKHGAGFSMARAALAVCGNRTGEQATKIAWVQGKI